MTDFELNIPEDIESTAWTEVDPFNNEGYNGIELSINWEKKTVDVYTYIHNQGTPMEEYHGLVSSFDLPYNVDASTFKEYYNIHIRPLILEMSNQFESYWDGSNWKGRFVSGEVNECGCDVYDETAALMAIAEKCDESWVHDKYIYRDVGESFNNYADIIDMLKCADIDFMSADLEDIDVVKAIRNYITDDCIYIMSDEDFASDIRGMRDTIQEDQDA